MPQLPSGRHVAIDVAPLTDLVERWHDDEAAEQLAGIRTVEDLFAYTRVLDLVPDARASGATPPLAPDSLQPPAGHVARDTGRRLSDWPSAFVDWSEIDRVAFQVFVDDRAMPYLESALARDATGIAKCSSAAARLAGFWGFACNELRWLPRAPDPLAPSAELAQSLRTGESLNDQDDRRTWLRLQLQHECENLFNDVLLERLLMARAPTAWGVVKTIAVTLPERFATVA